MARFLSLLAIVLLFGHQSLVVSSEKNKKSCDNLLKYTGTDAGFDTAVTKKVEKDFPSGYFFTSCVNAQITSIDKTSAQVKVVFIAECAEKVFSSNPKPGKYKCVNENYEHVGDRYYEIGCTADASYYTKIYDDIVQPMIADLTSSLEQRFPDGGVVKAFAIFDLKSLQRNVLHDNGVNDLFTEEIELLKKRYTTIRQKEEVNENNSTTLVDVTPLFDLEVDLIEEWTRFKYLLRNIDSQRLTSWEQFYDTGYADQFPNVLKLISISLILPLSTAIVERGFSAMNAGIKNRLRNSLAPETVDKLLRI